MALSKSPSSGTDAAQEATILGRVDFNREKCGFSPTQHGDFAQQNIVFLDDLNIAMDFDGCLTDVQ